MGKAEKNTFVNYLIQFPDQLNKVLESFNSKKIKIEKNKIKNVICLGMGGSAISGDIIKDILSDRVNLPISIICLWKILMCDLLPFGEI